MAQLAPLLFIFAVSFTVFLLLVNLLSANDKTDLIDLNSPEIPQKRRFFLWQSYHSPYLQQFLQANRFKELNRLLSQANWRGEYALLSYFLLRAFIFGIGVCLLYYMVRSNVISQIAVIALMTLLLFYITWKLPIRILQSQKKRYQQELRFALSAVMELLVICFEAGNSIDNSLVLVAKTLRRDHPQMSNELLTTVEEMRLLPTRQQAWQGLLDRTDIPELKSLVQTLQQHEQTGSSLSETLHTQAEYLRKSRLANAEQRAMKIPALMSTTVGLFFFPIMLVIIVVPLMLYFSNLFAELF